MEFIIICLSFALCSFTCGLHGNIGSNHRHHLLLLRVPRPQQAWGLLRSLRPRQPGHKARLRFIGWLVDGRAWEARREAAGAASCSSSFISELWRRLFDWHACYIRKLWREKRERGGKIRERERESSSTSSLPQELRLPLIIHKKKKEIEYYSIVQLITFKFKIFSLVYVLNCTIFMKFPNYPFLSMFWMRSF